MKCVILLTDSDFRFQVDEEVGIGIWHKSTEVSLLILFRHVSSNSEDKYMKKITLIGNETEENCLARANQLRQEGKLDEAIATYQKAIEIVPENSSRILAKLARVMMHQGNIEGAVTAYQKAITQATSQKPKQPKWFYSLVYTELGEALEKNGQVDEAIAVYQKAIDLYQKKPTFYVKQSQMYFQKALIDTEKDKTGLIDKAIEKAKAALEIEPDFAPAMDHLELIYEKRKEGKKQQNAKLQANYVNLIEAGIKAQQQGNQELALEQIQQAIEKNPQKKLGYWAIDKILRELGKLEEANGYYYQLSKTTPEAWEEEYILKLRVGHVRDGILIPLADLKPFQGGIKTNKNCPTYFYHLRTKFFEPTTDIKYLEQQDDRPSVKLNGTYLYAGFAFKHFGHYMAECTHRLWAYSKLSSQIKGVVVLPEKKLCHKLSPFMEQAMTYMQIPLERVQLISTITEVEHLIVPEQASHLYNPFKLSSSYLDFLSENEEKFFHSYESQNSCYPEKLYVSRSHLIHQGGIAGEAYIENLLQEDENFYIFKPENYSLYEQMNYYRHAKVCIFSEGSAIHGLELLGWLNKMSTVAIIFRRKFNRTLAQVIPSRSQNLCTFKSTQKIHPLNNRKDKTPVFPAARLSIFSNVDLLLQFFRDNDLPQLKNFKLNDFYRQEAIDILKYVMKININKNNFNSDVDFLSYFNQFRNDIRQFSQNPYLKDCL